MAHFILFDSKDRDHLYPFSLTRSLAEIRIGIGTIREKWERYMSAADTIQTKTFTYLDPKTETMPQKERIWINSTLLPDKQIFDAIRSLPAGSVLTGKGKTLAVTSADTPFEQGLNSVEYPEDFLLLEYPWHIFQYNNAAILEDFASLKREKEVSDLGPDVKMIKKENIFVADSAKITNATLNATNGPIFIGKNAVIMEGSHLFGPVVIGEGAVVKMGAKIYGTTTLGPECVVGGELKNSVLFGYSNKAHDGYMGDSVVGEWCNWGAGTSCSNLKNSTGTIKIKINGEMVQVGQKCGVFMGDYSRTAILTRINSGTRIGVSSHLHEPGFPEKDIPSFYWSKTAPYEMEKAVAHAAGWMQLKGKEMTEAQKDLLRTIYKKEIQA